jgi:flagellar biosynthetic protein FliQ
MNADFVLALLSDVLWTGLKVSLPLLCTTMLIGLLISVLQVATQIQEMSLSFVPKLVAAAVSLNVFGPWMLHQLTAFSARLWRAIPSLL